jgi:hypothetical protein
MRPTPIVPRFQILGGYCGTSRTTGPRTAGAAGAAAFGVSIVWSAGAGLLPCPMGPNQTAAASTTTTMMPPKILAIASVSIPLVPWSPLAG